MRIAKIGESIQRQEGKEAKAASRRVREGERERERTGARDR